MQMGDHLGWAGLLLALVGLALTYLLPNKRWIGYVCLTLALAVGCLWWVFAHRVAEDVVSAPAAQDPPTRSPTIIQNSVNSDCSNLAASQRAEANCELKEKNDHKDQPHRP
jgi:hypothetical protein